MSFEQPHDIDDATMAFPADVSHLMPKFEDIPDQFRMMKPNPYVQFQERWFFEGLSESSIPDAKAGIDQGKALRHLAAIQRSFQPKHEHKVAAVAYLASLWLEEPKKPEDT